MATKVYVSGLGVFASALLGGWLYLFGASPGYGWVALGAGGVLALVGALGRRFPMEFGRAAPDLADVATLTALALLGPMWALAVAFPATLYRDRLRTVFAASGDAVKVLGAGASFLYFSQPLLFGGRFDASFAYGILAAGLAYYALDALINTALVCVKYGTPPARVLGESILPLVPADVAVLFTVLGTSYAAAAFSPVAAIVLFSGAAGALVMLYLLHDRQKEIEGLRSENEALKADAASGLSSPLAFASRLIESLGLKDGHTARRAAASAVYATDIAKELGLEPARVEKLRLAALLQDVGLASVPDEVLLTKFGKLNSVGKAQLEQHPIQSERILSGVAGFEDVARWTRWHHEREDGTGYPDRLRGEWIPLEAKILAVSGQYASLILDDPHSPGIAPQEARRELTRLAGTGLDAVVVRAFLRLLDSEDGNYARAADDRFAFPVAAPGPGRSPSGGGAGPLRPTGTAAGADPR